MRLGRSGRADQPAAVIQGNLELVNLVGTPWLPAAAWPGSELVLIDEAGHGGSRELISAIIAATDRFARCRDDAYRCAAAGMTLHAATPAVPAQSFVT